MTVGIWSAAGFPLRGSGAFLNFGARLPEGLGPAFAAVFSLVSASRWPPADIVSPGGSDTWGEVVAEMEEAEVDGVSDRMRLEALTTWRGMSGMDLRNLPGQDTQIARFQWDVID